MKVRKQTAFNWIEEVIYEDFGLQDKYCLDVSKFIDEEYRKRREKILEELKDEDRENLPSIWKYQYPFEWESAEVFHDTFLKSAFIGCWGLFENHFKEISNLILVHYKIPLKIEDLQGNSDIDKCYKYLKKLANIKFDELNKEWEIIKCCKNIRNKIIHNNSIFSKDEKFDLKKCCNGIVITAYESESQKITIKSVDFILAFNVASKAILLKLLEEMDLRIQNEKV